MTHHMNAQARWYQRLGMKQRRGAGAKTSYKGQPFIVVDVKRTLAEAQNRMTSDKAFRDEMVAKYGVGGLHGTVKKHEYKIKKWRRTQNYGQTVFDVYAVLRRTI